MSTVVNGNYDATAVRAAAKRHCVYASSPYAPPARDPVPILRTALALGTPVAYPGLVPREAQSMALWGSAIPCACKNSFHCTRLRGERWMFHKRPLLLSDAPICPACELPYRFVHVMDPDTEQVVRRADAPMDLPRATDVYCPGRNCEHAFVVQ